MDPVLLASTVVTSLAPYLAKAAGKLTDTLTDKFAGTLGDAALKKTGEFYAWLKQRLAGTPAANNALATMEKSPDDTASQAALSEELKKLIASDPDFLKQLTSMFAPIANQSGAANFNNQVAGDVGKIIQINNANDIQIS
ncbi:MAG TPA: hypothetical protein VFW00_13405 [Rhodocyclaceae bacterium]|nr:hypothetical protein [Rhodocyclaceae bacterium]